ncbi:MAG: alanine racemase [Clostridia bacterium]|nr:alanine racemase [Clostridia bacterium]
MHDTRKRTWAEVKATAFQYNMAKMKERLPEGCKYMGIVKADAYGHGAVPVAKMLERYGCEYFAVACLEEAKELRQAGIKQPILILSETPAQFITEVAKLGVTQTVSSLVTAKEYSNELEKAGMTVKVHFKLETGMGRTGFDVKSGDVLDVVKSVKLPGFEVEGIFTHCAVSDEPDGAEYTKMQFRLFIDAVEKIEKESGVKFTIKHCANSGVMYNYPEMYLDMVRPGIALYGVYSGFGKGNIDCGVAMELKTRVVQLNNVKKGDTVSYGRTFTADKDMKVAVVAIGYGDGLHRCLSGKIDMLAGGKRCRQIGRICMDMCMLDVTDVPDIKVGDIVTVFGHDGREVISVNEVAEKAGTISYEMLCAVAARVPRCYIG